jgi:secreted trypsin-like serine protease
MCSGSVLRQIVGLLLVLSFNGLALATWAHAQHIQACHEPRPKVVGGWRATLKNWPWLATLRLVRPDHKEGWHHCGASIIGREWLLSAAHCFLDKTDPNPLNHLEIQKDAGGIWRDKNSGLIVQATAGNDDLADVAAIDVYEIADVVLHPAYRGNPSKDGNDLSLIRLKRPWNGAVVQLSLKSASDPLATAAKPLLVAGFGDTYDRSLAVGEARTKYEQFRTREPLDFQASTKLLLETYVPLVDQGKCRSSYPTAHIGDGQICAGYDHGERDSCQGDSGGPVVAQGANGCPYQIGLVSWGNGCARKKYYGVYTRVSAHGDWIAMHAGDVRHTAALAVPVEMTSNERAAFVEAAVQQLRDTLGPSVRRLRVRFSEGKRLKLGRHYTIEVESDVGGQPLLIDVDAAHQVSQLLPNRPSNELVRLKPGDRMVLPNAGHRFTHFQAVEPTGKGELLVLVVPNDFPLEATVAARQQADRAQAGKPILAPAGYLLNLVDQIAGYVVARPDRSAWRLQVVDYEVVR